MKLSVSAYRAHASAHKKILSSSYQSTLNYGSTAASCSSTQASELFSIDPMTEPPLTAGQVAATMMSGNSGHAHHSHHHSSGTKNEQMLSPTGGDAQTTTTTSVVTSKDDEESSDCKSPGQRSKSNQRWMKLRTTVQLSSAIQKKAPLKREDSFLKRFSTRQIPEAQETMEETGSESASGDHDKSSKRRRRYLQKRRTVVNPDENFYFHWLMVLTICILYNLWTLIVRQSFPELQELIPNFWFSCDCISDIIFIFDIIVQLRTGYLEQGLMVYDDKKLALNYMRSRRFLFDLAALIPLDILQIRLGTQPLLRFPRFLKVYRSVKFYYIVESRTVWPNLWRVVNLIHILLILAHWFGCFYFLLSEVENFQGDWVYPYRPGDYATLTRKYLGSLYWSTLTLTTIGDLPTPETNAEYIFTIVSYLIGVFIFATIVGQVGNVITNRNANRLEFERLLDGAKTYMRHHKVPGGMKRRVLRWYDYSWSRGRIQGGGDINTALGLLPDKLKTELALHVNLSVLKKVTIFQECQPEFLHDLVLKMKAYIFTPGDSICRKGEVAREMFIIADGILEVLSETGKVLTTMKAGDFFGEIGILNLDGLNKRTADVRSVGYSELFSLSREDVLAAMKDYPEAQEILQTLGHKRLMEVRCVNKKHAKNVAERESIANKLRSDVKGIKNVLKKSRWATGRRSNESIELQPLHLKGPKGVLRRMPRVRSDEMSEAAAGKEQQQQHQVHQQQPHQEKEKTPSPIGAGLPLLERLRLLKEKQQSIQEQESGKRDVVGPGLPLIKRLLLLKAKEERLAKESHAKLAQPTNVSTVQTISDTISSTSMLSLLKTAAAINTTSTGLMPATATSGHAQPLSSASSSTPSTKPKVSFRDRIKSLQHGETKQTISTSSSTSNQLSNATTIEPIEYGQLNKSMSIGNIGSNAGPSHSSKSTKSPVSLKDKIKHSTVALKPWSKLKLATVKSGSSYTSLNNSMTETSPTHKEQENHQQQQQHQSIKIAKIIPITAAIATTTITTSCSITSIPEYKQSAALSCAKRVENVKKPERICTSDSEIRTAEPSSSSEYGGLSFVKKLKILNERQKLAELELVMKARSFSLDCPDLSDVNEPIEPLIRSHSESSGMTRPKIITITSPQTNIDDSVSNPVSTPSLIPLSPESNETIERRELKSILKRLTEEKGSLSVDITTNEADEQMQGLLRAPTVEGPPNSAHSVNERCSFPLLSNAQPTHNSTTTFMQFEQNQLQSHTQTHSLSIQSDISISKLVDDSNNSRLNVVESITGNEPAVFLHDLSPTSQSQHLNGLTAKTEVPGEDDMAKQPFISNKLKIIGSFEEHELFNDVLFGIKNVIDAHMRDIQLRYEDQFKTLEYELCHRDVIIAELRQRIHDLGGEALSPILTADERRYSTPKSGNGSSGSSGDIPFVRGDSLDTIFASSPPDSDIRKDKRIKTKTKKRTSPRRRRQFEQHQQESTDQEIVSYDDSSHTGLPRKSSNMIINNITGNLTQISDSVILDIEPSSDGSHTDVDEDDDLPDDARIFNEEDEVDDSEDQDEELQHDNWEAQMLAAELNRRESKRDEPLSSDASEIFDSTSGIRQRMAIRSHTLDTDTENSEIEIDRVQRPRAASVDHQTVRQQRAKGILKALSFDCDKDRL